MLMLALLAGAIGCTKDDDVAPAPSSTSTPAPSTGSSGSTTGASTVDKTTMLRLVNEARKKGCSCGATYMPPVDTVVWNSKLEQAALLHSQDMNKNSYFDHTGLDGSTPATRITAVGYTWQAVGENIARGVHLRKGRCRCLARQRGALQEYHEQALYGNGRCPRRQLLDPGVRQTPKVAAPRRSLHEASLHREAFFMCAIFNKFPKKGWIEGAVGLL